MEHEDILNRLKKEVKDLKSDREYIVRKRDKQLEEIRKNIDRHLEAIDFYSNQENALVCPNCKGTGEERFEDGAGDMDWRTCEECNGIGFIPSKLKES